MVMTLWPILLLSNRTQPLIRCQLYSEFQLLRQGMAIDEALIFIIIENSWTFVKGV
jgi:hypothetical protein